MTDDTMSAKEMREFLEKVETHRAHEAMMFRAISPEDRLVAKEALDQRDIARNAQEEAESLIGSCDFIYDEKTGENVPKVSGPNDPIDP